jgi:hypothetical protein
MDFIAVKADTKGNPIGAERRMSKPSKPSPRISMDLREQKRRRETAGTAQSTLIKRERRSKVAGPGMPGGEYATAV